MRRVELLCACTLAGCGWFQPPDRCEISSTSCDGATIRICVPDPSERTADGMVATRWNELTQCVDDPVLGPQTCAEVSGVATCVRATADGEVATAQDFAEGHYLRVRVGEGEIGQATDTYLDARPVSAMAGRWALVARAGDTAKDAALVSVGEDAWVWADGVTRLELVGSDGTVRDVRELGREKAIGMTAQALIGDLPPVVRVSLPGEHPEVPPEASRAFGDAVAVVEPPRALLELVGDAMQRVTVTAASAVNRVAFVKSLGDPSVEDDAGVPLDAAGAGEMGDANRRLLSVRVYYGNATLWVDASSARQELLTASTDEQLAMARDVVHAIGEAVLFVTSASRARGGASSGRPELERPEARLPDDFPEEVAQLLKARMLPLLAPGEDVASAWSALQAATVQAGLAGGYRLARPAYDDARAVADGFASAAGSVGAPQDFAEYVAMLALPEAFPVYACERFDGRPLERLEVRTMTTLVKALAVFGLGLVDRSALNACTGDLDGSLSAPGIVVHKPSGESVTFAGEVHAVRSPYYAGASRWAATASRGGGNEIALVQLMYSDSVPELVRLRAVSGPAGDDAFQRQSAAFSVSGIREGSVGITAGGLLLVQRATRERFEGFMIAAAMRGEALGASMLPLVVFRFDSPFWQDRLL